MSANLTDQEASNLNDASDELVFWLHTRPNLIVTIHVDNCPMRRAARRSSSITGSHRAIVSGPEV